jgi:uncharacterized protein (TIGR00251 family)
LRIRVKVKTNARECRVEKIGDNDYIVMVKEPPKQGRANAALLKLLSRHFEGRIRIVSGVTSRNKIIEIKK